MDRPRSGKPRQYSEEFRNQVLATLELPPPRGQAVWDGPAVAKQLNASAHAVWRVLRKEGISLARQRSWCVSTDPEFAAKAAEVVGLYLNPPENALVLSVDEKPSIQALERATGYVETGNGKVVRGFRSTYKRHGTLNLFAALEISTGAIRTQITHKKRRVEFLEFMDQVVADVPKGKEIHVILDNYCIHKRNQAWLAIHPNVTFHFTPTSEEEDRREAALMAPRRVNKPSPDRISVYRRAESVFVCILGRVTNASSVAVGKALHLSRQKRS